MAETNSVDTMYAVAAPAMTNGVRSAITASPSAGAAAGVLNAAPGVAATFAGGKLFGVGVMEAASAGDATSTYVATASIEVDGHRAVLFGLIDAFTTGSGLQSLALTLTDNGTQVFSRTFASATEAELFFDDQVLRIGLSDYYDHELLLSTSFTYSGTGAFSFGYALGIAAVPEPAVWTLMLAGPTVVLVGRQRQRRRD